MKKLITLLLVLTGMVSSANATTYYWCGGNTSWTPQPTETLSQVSEGTYAYTLVVNGTIYFNIADGQGSSDSDWDGFAEKRLSYSTYNNAQVQKDTPYVLDKRGGNSMMFTGNGTYCFTFVESSQTLTITEVAISSVYLCGAGDALGNWNAANALQMDLQSDGTYQYKLTDQSSANYEYKFVIDGQYWQPGDSQNFSVGAGSYDVTFTFDPTTYTISASSEEYYYLMTLPEGESWSVKSTKMTMSNGVYSDSFDGSVNMLFAFAPSSAISSGSVSDWSKVVRPNISGDGNRYNVIIQHMSGNTHANGSSSCAWLVEEPATYSVTYTLSTGVFTSDAETTETITAAGWATYSTGRTEGAGAGGYTISGAKVYYVNGTAEGKANLVLIPDGTVIPSKFGVMVEGSSFTVNTNSSDGSLSGNLLKGSGCNDYYLSNESYKDYILYGSGSTLGFYPASSNSRLDLHKAWLRLPSDFSLARISINFDEINGISNINSEKVVNNRYYNLNGQVVEQPTKGLYITNGKKVLVK